MRRSPASAGRHTGKPGCRMNQQPGFFCVDRRGSQPMPMQLVIPSVVPMAVRMVTSVWMTIFQTFFLSFPISDCVFEK